jgi:hypothetical protein
MHIEIDQSGKVEDTSRPTVLAFANHIRVAVVIPAAVKKECLAVLRRRSDFPQVYILQIFTAGLVCLLRDYLFQIETITIDLEYPGHEADIKGILLNAIRRVRRDFSKQQISFRSVGKKSGAHYKAYGVFTGKEKPERILTTEDIVKVLRK